MGIDRQEQLIWKKSVPENLGTEWGSKSPPLCGEVLINCVSLLLISFTVLIPLLGSLFQSLLPFLFIFSLYLFMQCHFRNVSFRPCYGWPRLWFCHWRGWRSFSCNLRELLICCDILLNAKLVKVGVCLNEEACLKLKMRQSQKWTFVCGLFCISSYLPLWLSDDFAILRSSVRYNMSSSKN